MKAHPIAAVMAALIVFQDAAPDVAESPESNVGNILQGILIALLLLAAAYAIGRRVFSRRRH